MSFDPVTTAAQNVSAIPPWLRLVQEKVEGLRFGVVQVVVHDGKVTQIERTDKTRLDFTSAENTTRRRDPH